MARFRGQLAAGAVGDDAAAVATVDKLVHAVDGQARHRAHALEQVDLRCGEEERGEDQASGENN